MLVSTSVYVKPPDLRAICGIGAGSGSGGKEVTGAWMLMVEVSVQDPAAPSWEFLQVRSYTVSRVYAITSLWVHHGPWYMHSITFMPVHIEFLIGCKVLVPLAQFILQACLGALTVDKNVLTRRQDSQIEAVQLH